MPQRTDSPDNEDAVVKRLSQIDAAANELEGMLAEARANWLKQKEDNHLKEVYNEFIMWKAGLEERRKALEAKLPGAAAYVALSETMVVQLLVQRYGHMLTTRKPDSSREAEMKRTGRIPVGANKSLADFGQYFTPAGYEDAVDELIITLLQLQNNFLHRAPASFTAAVQLLRLVGAPGTGKTTFASAVWDQLLPRLQYVQCKIPELWRQWAGAGDPERLLRRLEASWCTEHGPLVFIMDMSEGDYNTLNILEKAMCTPAAQLAARMLWAALDTRSAGIIHYGQFLDDLKSGQQPVLQALTAVAVQRFVLQAAGVAEDVGSMITWVWDEVNSVELQDGEATTFCQRHLSDAVLARRSIQKLCRVGGMDLLPVLVACSTRGSSISLALTASKKARIQDLKMPPAEVLQKQLPLVFIDLLRRLDPTPPPFAEALHQLGISCDVDLSQLTAEQQAKLCPPHVAKALEWAGGNMRCAAHVLGALSGQPPVDTLDLRLGGYEWWAPSKARPLPQVVNLLVNAMEQAGWTRWLSQDGPNYPVLLQVVAWSLCNVPVARSQVLPVIWQTGGRGAVTLEQLERDGVVQLVQQGSQLAVGQAPDDLPQRVVLPPALLAAFLRSFTWESELPTLELLQGMIEGSRTRERDDLTLMLLRLLLWRFVIRRQTLQMEELLPSLAGSTMGAQHVQIPDKGFVPDAYPHDLTAGKLQGLLEAALASPDQPWCWVLVGTSGPDSMMVLRTCDAAGQLTGGSVVLHLQSKLTVQDKALSAEMVRQEVCKPQPTKPGFGATTVLAIMADQRPQRYQSASSLTSTEQQYMAQLQQGKPVYWAELERWVTVVFREQQWQVRGGAALLYDKLRATQPNQPQEQQPSRYDDALLSANNESGRGRPKLQDPLQQIENWKLWLRENEPPAEPPAKPPAEQ